MHKPKHSHRRSLAALRQSRVRRRHGVGVPLPRTPKLQAQALPLPRARAVAGALWRRRPKLQAKALPLVLLLPLLLVTGCADSGLGRTWAAPDAQRFNFRKLAVIALTKQEVYRMQAEDALVQEMSGRGVASHDLLPGLNALRDTAAVLKAVRAAGCDGIVTLQLKSGAIKPDPNAKPVATTTTAAQELDDYWVDPSAQETQNFAPGQYFAVEVHVFDLVKGMKVWDGLAVEQDARDAADLIRLVRQDVVRDLRKRGLIAE